MKKLTAIILVLALALSLSATALAAGGSTSVNVTVNSSNISVSVPLALAITAKVDGGDATVPSDYKITNSSSIPVKVDTIAITLNDSDGWAFTGTTIAANTASTAANKNQIFISLNGQALAVQEAAAPTTPINWNISADSDLNIPVLASTSKLNQTSNEPGLITITYVISAGTHS